MASSGGELKGIPVPPEQRAQLDSSWSLEAQVGALKGSGAEDDLTFRESSVKDVTDRGRSQGAGQLQKALEHAMSAAPPKPAPSAQPAAPAQTPEEKQREAELQRGVRELLLALRRSWQEGESAKRTAAAMTVLRQLSGLKVSVACLKATRIAAELNQPCWKGSDVAPEVRGLATSLVRDWRAMYRAQEGGSAPALSPAVLARKCRTVSMDLEECAYGKQQKVATYSDLVEGLCRLLAESHETSSGLLAGTVAVKQLVARVDEQVRRVQTQKRRRLV